MKYIASWSQFNTFLQCKKWWFNNSVAKIIIPQDTSNMDAGKIIHECLEFYHNGTITNSTSLKEHFKKEWNCYGLEKSKLGSRQDEYWLCVLNGMEVKKIPTSTELKIFFDDVRGILDSLDSNNDTIWDWKSSIRTKETEHDYSRQLIFYSWLYQRKFGRIPKEVAVHFLKYPGSKGTLSFCPTQSQIDEIAKDYENVRNQMEAIIATGKAPEGVDRENCAFFCPYKDICFSTTDKYTLEITGNNIRIIGALNPLLIKGIDKKFSFELQGSFFIKKNYPMANTTVRFYNRSKQMLPIGFLDGLKKTLSDFAEYRGKKLELIVVDLRQQFPNITAEPKGTAILRDYQIDAKKKFIENKIGILQMGTGSGKSLTATDTIRDLKVKTLIIVNRIELATQWKGVLMENINAPIGMIGRGENSIEDITIATIQTLAKNIDEYKEYLSTVQFVIFDECHNLNFKSYKKVHDALKNTIYRLGLSGTPRRNSGDSMYLEAITGKVIYEYNAKEAIADEWLIEPRIIFMDKWQSPEQFEKVKSSVPKEGLINETEKYNAHYRQFITVNEERNNAIKKLCEKYKDKKVLVLVKMIEHGELLSIILNAKYFCGDTKKEEREQLLEEFKNGTRNLLIGTMSIFSEGLDIPNLEIVVNAAGQKSDIKTVQSLGRLLRKHKDKNQALYFDFVDNGRFFYMATRERIESFEDEGHEVSKVKFI